jgi:hypothetical protein
MMFKIKSFKKSISIFPKLKINKRNPIKKKFNSSIFISTIEKSLNNISKNLILSLITIHLNIILMIKKVFTNPFKLPILKNPSIINLLSKNLKRLLKHLLKISLNLLLNQLVNSIILSENFDYLCFKLLYIINYLYKSIIYKTRR